MIGKEEEWAAPVWMDGERRGRRAVADGKKPREKRDSRAGLAAGTQTDNREAR
jgi:hypothetical protein